MLVICSLINPSWRLRGHATAVQGWTVQLMVKRAGLAVEDFKEDATEFKPARWLESDGQPLKTSPRGFMPFGGVSYANLFLASHGIAWTLHAQPCSART